MKQDNAVAMDAVVELTAMSAELTGVAQYTSYLKRSTKKINK